MRFARYEIRIRATSYAKALNPEAAARMDSGLALQPIARFWTRHGAKTACRRLPATSLTEPYVHKVGRP